MYGVYCQNPNLTKTQPQFNLNPIKHGVRQVAISWGGGQSARSLIGLSRELIRPFHGHHTHLYSVGVSYGASRKKIFKKS